MNVDAHATGLYVGIYETLTAARTFTKAPAHPLLRVAWAAGFRELNQIHEAVRHSRAAGATWREISEALGENPATAETKYGTGLERMRRYRARLRADS